MKPLYQGSSAIRKWVLGKQSNSPCTTGLGGGREVASYIPVSGVFMLTACSDSHLANVVYSFMGNVIIFTQFVNFAGCLKI